jgi:hypothetical protein
VAVDHPLVAVEHRAGLEAGGVAARGAGLGHREAAARLAFEQRRQPALALLGGGVLGQDLHVAGVRSRAVEDHRGDEVAPHVLAQQPVVEVREPGPVFGVGQEQVPQALGLRALAKLHQDARVGDPGADLVVERPEGLLLDRIDVIGDEPADALAQRLDLRGGVEVHGGQATGRA